LFVIGPYGAPDGIRNPPSGDLRGIAALIDKTGYSGICGAGDTAPGLYRPQAGIEKLKNLKYHFFGHVHSGRGNYKENGIQYINASAISSNKELISDYFVIDIK